MKNFIAGPSKLCGSLKVPPSKSHTQRALLFAMMGQKVSRISNFLNSSDCRAMCTAVQTFGSTVQLQDNILEIQGGFSRATKVIDAENSGQILRFLAAMSALLPSYAEITGDASIRKNRPIKPLLSALGQLGALAESSLGDGYAPITIRGPITPGTCRLNGKDSQPVSALLMATSFLEGPSEIIVDDPGETPWIDLTLDWLRRLGARVTHENYFQYFVEGGLTYEGFEYTVPGDFSSAAFPIVAALITQSSLTLKGLSSGDIQGDKALIEQLKKMGADISWDADDLIIKPSELSGLAIDVNHIIDAIPILATLGCFASGKTILFNGEIARHKESDRISTICFELKKMGAHIEERKDGLIIYPSDLIGAQVSAHEDHRIGLALSVAALGAKGSTKVTGIDCLDKSYPSFISDMQSVGADIELDLVRV